jgi:hypothetical protein
MSQNQQTHRPARNISLGGVCALADASVVTTTTCEVGLNYIDTPTLTLHRFLDGNDISWIEFEAEMSGFTDVLRKVRWRLERLAHWNN